MPPTGNIVRASSCLVEHVDHVALVLGGIGAAVERVTPVGGAPDVGVMPGGDGIESEQVGALGEAGELHRAIALDARVRCDAACVRVDVRCDDVLVEVVAEVEDEMVDAELLSDAAGVVDVGHRTAPGVAVTAPELHRHPDHVVAGLLEQERRDRRVDATAHGAHDLHRRSRSTAATSTSRARSMSASVVVWPSVSRSEPRAVARSTPIAASTCDGSIAPLAHADAADAQTSCSSSR